MPCSAVAFFWLDRALNQNGDAANCPHIICESFFRAMKLRGCINPPFRLSCRSSTITSGSESGYDVGFWLGAIPDADSDVHSSLVGPLGT